MNLPRRLRLADGPEGLRLVQHVDESAARHFPELAGNVPDSGVYRLRHNWHGAEGGGLALSLFDETDPVLVVERKGGNAYEVTFLRKGHPGIDAARGYASRFSFSAVVEGAFDLDVFVDNGLVEIGCAGGRHWVSNLYFPADPAGVVTIST
jgi:hypothetical protein